MYERPQLERLGTLRELTQNGARYGIDFVDFYTDSSSPTCNPNSPAGSPSSPMNGVCGSRGSR